MIRLGLVGFPLDHSLSPAMHEAALRASGLQGSYLLYPVKPGNTQGLRNLIQRVSASEVLGLNVTIPHKQTVLPMLDSLTPSATRIGAVNTILSRNGQTIGENTDAPGFLADLDKFLPAPASALVLGAGGAARAVVYALRSRGCRISVAARKVGQLEQLARGFPDVQTINMCAEELEHTMVDLIVNATPVGMFPHADESPWPPGLPFPNGAAIYDLVYNPQETRLVRSARTAGLRAVTGLGMLIEQAQLAFELWTGYKVKQEVLYHAIAQAVH